MTNDPFGTGEDPDAVRRQMAEFLRQLGIQVGPDGEVDMAALLQQMQSRLTMFGGANTPSGINWQRTKDTARQVTASLGADPTPSPSQAHAVQDAVRLSDLWLDAATALPALSSQPVAWSRADWVEHTMDAWRSVTEPIVTAIAKAMGGLISPDGDDDGVPPELAGLGAMLAPMLNQVAGSMYSMQLAQALGTLATQVVTATEIGMQLLANPQVAVLVHNVAAFTEGLDVSESDVLLYLAVRENARQRLFAQVGWLAPALLALLEHYAREIRIDTSAIENAIDPEDLTGLNPEKLAELSSQLQGRLFEPTRTDEQVQILQRLETLIAVIEGWVDDVTQQATQAMPTAGALLETLRRRRGAGGPAENVFQALVGLELRPRRVRDAANLWAALRSERGVEGRDAVWRHPDLVPTAEALDDPLGYVHPDQATSEVDDLDMELRKLLADEGRDPGETEG